VGKGGTSVLVAGIITLGACASSHRASSPGASSPGASSPGATSSQTADPAPTTTSTGAQRPGPASTARPRPVPAPTTTTPGPVPAFSFDQSVPPPRIVNTGTDYVAILESLERYGNWLGAHRPDPALALTTVTPGTQLLANYTHDLVNLRDNSVRIIEKLNGPTTYTILSKTPDAFSARVVENISVHQTVDRSGRVTSERRFVGPTTYLDVVVRSHGRWYFAASDIQLPAVVHL
jgi:hypothetical protein